MENTEVAVADPEQEALLWQKTMSFDLTEMKFSVHEDKIRAILDDFAVIDNSPAGAKKVLMN